MNRSVRLRLIVLDAIERILGGAYSNLLLPELLAHGDWSPGERAFAERIVKGVLEHREDLELELAGLLTKGKDGVPARVMAALLSGVYQIRFMTEVHRSAAVNGSVELVKRDRRFSGLSGLVNAVLRKVEVRSESSPTETSCFNHPQWMVERWERDFGIDTTRNFCQANNRMWPIFLRTNLRKISRSGLVERLRDEGIEGEPSAYTASGVRVERGAQRLTKSRAFDDGLFFIQDESASMVGVIADPKGDELVLDLCAAPGGKTTHLAELMGDRGRILAVDSHAARLRLIEENARRLGLVSVECIQGDGRELALKPEFDLVLVDAPCSGHGTLGRKKDLRWNRKPEDLPDLNRLQRSLLARASTLVKPTGRIVYSTCSIEKCENEEIIGAFLSDNPGFGVVPVSTLPSEVTEGPFLRTWPHLHGCAGAFAAILTRKE